MTFEQALAEDDLDTARTLLDELAVLPETGGLYMPECYADLARSFDHQGRHDDAITAMERAIDHGWSGRPDGRSDVAEFHLRAGRSEQAAQIWAELKADDPGEVWLYNAAGLSYSEIGEHELAVMWLGEGIELGMSTEDPEGIVAQLSDIRCRSLQALGREPDELEQRVEPFLEQCRERERERSSRYSLLDALEGTMSPPDAPAPPGPQGETAAIAVSWFPGGQYEQAIERWPSLAEDWADVAHADYCRRLEGNIKWTRAHDVPVRAVAPIVVEDFIAWCEERDEDPEHARALYSAHRFADCEAIPWPPARNEPCWCGSQRKYKKCCGPAPAAPMHDPEP
ncbi:MAG: SEC-C metal-binding domain-containing protein [Solirubrobacteraceae bacterium]